MKNTGWFIIFLGLFFASCHKDSEFLESEIISSFSPEIVQETSGFLAGYVYDQEGKPVADALVQIYSGMTRTNEHGVFSFGTTRLDKQGTYVRVIKSGYMTGSDMVYPTDGKNMSYVQLLEIKKEKSFESSIGGEIAISGGGKLVFPPDAISKTDGSSYSGKVYATAYFLSPNDPDLGDKMPGALIAQRTNGNTVVLGTAGMFAAELRDANGNKLNIKNGNKVRFEIPARSDARPPVIELWHFDESKGVWKEEGMATLSSGMYTGEVSHFSFWNCDVPFPLINVCGKVLNKNGEPIAYARVRVSAEGLNAAYGLTDERGEFCGKMPKGKVLTFKIFIPGCEDPSYSVQVGPFENNTQLDPFVLDIPEDRKLTGTVSCDNNSVEEPYVVLTINERRVVIPVGEDGKFDYFLPSCLNISVLKIFGFDNVTGKTSLTLDVNPNDIPVLLINLCQPTCDFEGELVFDCVSRRLSVRVSGGSGNFSFLWSNGWENDSIQITQNLHNTVLCVVVRDNAAQCEKQYCQLVDRVMELRLEYFCGAESIKSRVFGGVAPYTYLWSNGYEGEELVISEAGLYTLTVTDALGCKVIKEIEAAPRIEIFEDNLSCSGHIIEIPSTPFAQGMINVNNPGSTISLTYPIRFSVFETGFNLFIVLFNSQCEIGKEFRLPQFKGLKSISRRLPSCGTCEDGKIDYEIDNNADCISCVFGGVRVLRDDSSYSDVTALNNAGNLPKGGYIVVVYDANTNCYIAFEKVKL